MSCNPRWPTVTVTPHFYNFPRIIDTVDPTKPNSVCGYLSPFDIGFPLNLCCINQTWPPFQDGVLHISASGKST